MPTFSAQFFLSPVVLYFHAVLFFIIIFVRLSSLSFFFFFWSYLLNTMSFLVLSHCLISLFLPPLEHSGVLAVTLTSIGVAGTGMDLIFLSTEVTLETKEYLIIVNSQSPKMAST